MEIIGWIIAFACAITIHEAAHAWMANKLGDPTPKMMGRLSLNPIVHYDPIGTTMLLVLTFMRALGIPTIPFGWAKPVQFNPLNLENPKRDSALISIAGPISNIFLSILASFILHILTPISSNWAYEILVPTIILNLSLAIFNLIPIHPLDGGKIFIGILPQKEAYEADIFLRKYGMLILLFLMFPTFRGISPLSSFMSLVIGSLAKFLIP